MSLTNELINEYELIIAMLNELMNELIIGNEFMNGFAFMKELRN